LTVCSEKIAAPLSLNGNQRRFKALFRFIMAEQPVGTATDVGIIARKLDFYLGIEL
jgi:hypothetical protein